MPAVRRLPHVLSAIVRQRGTSCSPASTAAAASGHAVHHHSHSHNCASAIFGPGGGLCRHGVHQLSGASSQSDGETVFEVDASKVKYGPGALAEVGNAATKVFQMKRVHDIDVTRSPPVLPRPSVLHNASTRFLFGSGVDFFLSALFHLPHPPFRSRYSQTAR